jgi:hypothetical protein
MENSLSLFLEKSGAILKRMHGSNNFGTTQNYLIDLCFRTYDILVAVENLKLSGLKQNELEHPVGILLRSTLYDFINFQYFYNQSIKKGELDKNLFSSLVKEHISSHLNLLSDNFELKEEYKNLDRFSEFGKNKTFKILGVLREGRAFAKSKKINYLEEAISIWEWYSKYEHYGAFTNLMYQKQEENSYRKFTAIQLGMANIYFSLSTMIDLGNELITPKDLKLIETIILNFKTNTNTQ